MKRIGFLTDSIFSFGGVQRVTAVIATALSKDYEVEIVTFDKPEEQDLTLYRLGDYPITYIHVSYPQVSRLKTLGCKAYSYLYRKMLPQGGLTSDLYAHSSFPSERQQALADLLRSRHYDVIIGVHAFLAIRLATIRKRVGGARTVGWIHNSFDALLRDGSPYLGKELRKHYGRQLQKLDATVVLNQSDADEYEKAFGYCPAVIANPLTLLPGKRSQGNSRRFLAVGRMAPQHKGFDLLVQAFARFATSHQDWQLDIVGDGPEHDALQQQIRECGMEGRITLHPFTSNIQKYYSQAQVYVLSSRWEGFGLVLVEAMAHGVPVVSSDLPSSRDILGDEGIYFRNGDVADMAQKMDLATHLDWDKASETAIRLAGRFDISNVIKQWKQLIEKV